MHCGEWQHDVSKSTEMRKKIVGLKNNARAAAMASQAFFVLRQRFAVDKNLAGIGGIETGQKPEQSGLATAGRPNERKRVSESDFEIHGIKDGLGAKLSCYPAQKDFHYLRSFSGISSGITPKSGRGTSTISSTITGSKGTPGATGGAARRSLKTT